MKELTVSSDAPGEKLFMLGNEAIARGAIEAGIQVAAAYPGTPSSEILETLTQVAKEFDIYVEWSVNEKVAFEVALAASICGLRAMACMKHVGVNVAHDPLMTAAYIGAKGGLVLLSADDPWAWSSQNEQDNRYIAEQAYIPILEPSSVQEAKDMTAQAFRLSEEFKHLFMVRSVTRIGHGRADITLGEIIRGKRKGSFQKDPAWLVYTPAIARRNRPLMIQRLQQIAEAVNELPYNKLNLADGAGIGVIACGLSYSYALEAIKWLELDDKVSLLKIGTPFPLPEKLVKKLLSSVKEVLVVEELEPFVELHVKAIAGEDNTPVKIHGKDLLPRIGELSTRKVTEAISKLSGAPSPVIFDKLDRLSKEISPLLPFRPPTQCAGCPHRASFYAIKLASQRVAKELGEHIEPIYPGDIGCYALAMSPPLEAVDTIICMGGSLGIASGLAHVVNAPIIAHLGDSTFFHAGIPALINAVYNKANITMVVLDNSATAMTGFQPHPGTGYTAVGEKTVSLKPEDVAKACGVKFVKVIDPFDLEKAVDTLEKAIRFNGPSVVVSRQLCTQIELSERKKRGEKTIPYLIDQEKCTAANVPYCQAACPLHIDVRGYTNLIQEGKFDEALRLIKEKLPFPGIIGRVCTHPCETKCKRREVDESIAINALKRSAADYGKAPEKDLTEIEEKKEGIAIVGGGAAGLMAAHDLRKMGYLVTIFEASPFLGGMLRIGIPEYRLPRDIVNDEIGTIQKLGVKVKLNTQIGVDKKLSELKQDFDAVFIATGAHIGRDLGIENWNTRLEGCVDGVEFLRKVNLGEKVRPKDKVVVVGGGNVAIDCARTCLRLGFRDVAILYRRSRDEMPGIKEEIEEAENEGVKISLLVNPTKVLTENRKVVGIECIRTKLGKLDASGRRRPIPVKGSEFVIKTDMIISAIGEQPDLSMLGDSGVKSTTEGLVYANRITLETNVPGIFAGGDMITGPATVIEAFAAGRKAAISIDRYFKGEDLTVNRENEGSYEGSLIMDVKDVAQRKRRTMSTLNIEKRYRNFREVNAGFEKEEAIDEAKRCLSCECRLCIRLFGCPAVIMQDTQTVIDKSICSACGVCAQICLHEAIVEGAKE